MFRLKNTQTLYHKGKLNSSAITFYTSTNYIPRDLQNLIWGQISQACLFLLSSYSVSGMRLLSRGIAI